VRRRGCRELCRHITKPPGPAAIDHKRATWLGAATNANRGQLGKLPRAAVGRGVGRIDAGG
jgi:hypothetical protein